ncbi:MAG: hypothetical protein HWE27_18605 [Gammaproteobacteria bacterium]|nr:hypothetical protein [Gammaproteobacteria bacterium]
MDLALLKDLKELKDLVAIVATVTGLVVSFVTVSRYFFDKKKYKMELQEKYFSKLYNLYQKHLEFGQLALAEPLSREQLSELFRLHQEASFVMPQELEDYSYQLISWFMQQRQFQNIINSRQKANQDPADFPEKLNEVLRSLGVHLVARAEDGDMLVTSYFRKYMKPTFPIFELSRRQKIKNWISAKAHSVKLMHFKRQINKKKKS